MAANNRYDAHREATHSYIGTCEECGAIQGAIVDVPHMRRDTAKTVAKFIRDGLLVTRVTHEEVRRGNWHCTCDDEGAAGEQLALFGEEVA